MYAIIKTGGKQYRVKKGDEFHVEKLDAKEGEDIELTEVLAVNNDEDFLVGKPVVEDAAVVAEIVEQGLEDTIIVFKYKPKKKYRRRREHRQPFTKLRIKDILLDGEVITKDEVLETEGPEVEETETVETVTEQAQPTVEETAEVEAAADETAEATTEEVEAQADEMEEETVEIDETITVEDVVDEEGDVVAEIVTDEITVEVDDQDQDTTEE